MRKVRTVPFERQETEILRTRFITGRNRTDRTAPTAFDDVQSPDREGDFLATASHIYILVNDSGTLKWSRVAVSVSW